MAVEIEPPPARFCKYCLGDDRQEDLIWPCQCKQEGFPMFVHRECLDSWRATSARRDCFFYCRECNFEFRFDGMLDDEASGTFLGRRLQSHRAALRRVVGVSLRNFALCSVLLQVLIFFTALLLRGIDREEQLVKLCHLTLVEGMPLPGSFSNALRHHKLTYYVSAGVVLFLLGLFTLVLGCLCYCNEDVCAHRLCFSGYCVVSFGIGQMLPHCGVLLGLLAVGVLIFMFAGVVGLAIGLVVLVQRMLQASARYCEMRHLATMYRVKDRAAGLSAMELPPNAEPPVEEIDSDLQRLAEFHYGTLHGDENSTMLIELRQM